MPPKSRFRPAFFLCRLCAIALFLILSTDTSMTESQQYPTSLTATCGDMSLRYDLHQGISLTVHGIEMIRGSSIWIMKPGWVGRLYGAVDNPRIFADATITTAEDGRKTILIQHRLPDETPGSFEGTQTITLHPDNRIEFLLDFRMIEDVPAIIEWTVGQINSAPLIGASYSATTSSGDVSGVVPVEAPSPDVEASSLANGLRELTIGSRIGPILFAGNEEAHLRFFDYRKNRFANDAKPIFWFGRLGTPLEYGEEYRYYSRIDFPDAVAPISQAVDSVEARVAIKNEEKALVPNQRNDVIIPTPKELTFTDHSLPLDAQTTIFVGDDPSPETEKAVKFILREMDDIYNLRMNVNRRPLPAKLPPGSILLGEVDRLENAFNICAPGHLKLPESAEGYLLHVDGNVAAISAKTGRGIFHGATTLVQLVTLDETGMALRGAAIRDWPSLPFRGIHCLSGRDTADEISRALRTLMARFKINNLVWECEYIIWDSAPEIAHSHYGMPKPDAAMVVQAAKENLVEITPLVQSLGHSEWIFVNGRNLDIAEDPETPYAYCPTNERSYDFIFSVYEEALELFDHPAIFHIGHDEVTMRGRFPWRSRKTGKSVTELVLADIDRLKSWFDERGVRLMMWGDMFLTQGEAPDATFAHTAAEAQERRALLPKDILIADWHYNPVPPEKYTSLQIWKDAGFTVVGAPWYNPVNIRNHTLQAIEVGAEGMLQTTWAGFNFKIDGNEQAWFQYYAYITAAHYFWSGDQSAPDELPFRPQDAFLKAWFGDRPLRQPKEGFFVDLSPVANRSLSDDGPGAGWFGYGESLDLSSFPADRDLFGETRFQIKSNRDHNSALILSGRLNPKGTFPRQATLTFAYGITASELHFLSASPLAGNELEKIGAIEIVYTDSTAATLELIYGRNIFALNDDRIGRDTRIAWTGRTAAGAGVHLWDLKWEN
ncbi:MAG: family 20 glycosylhydrolase, partial [Gemmatimonadetes bacterium]|nr:family 20 glycosylhydrolase [Gemmatimonadota bacterium]